MTGGRLLRGLAPLLLCMLTAMSAQADESWQVQNRLQGKIKKDAPQKAEDVSGIACAPGALPRVCLVVDDETQGAQVVVLTQDRLIAGDFLDLIDDEYEGKKLELDAEGVAYADGFFYVAGSQGRARHEDDADEEARNVAKAAATRKIFRIAMAPEAVVPDTGVLNGTPLVDTSAVLAKLLQSDPVLTASFDRPLDKNGLTLEGIAVRGENLYAALRGPVLDDGSAVIARLPLAAVFDGASGAATIFRVNLGKDTQGDPRGIRDITVSDNGFLLIAGPVEDPPKKHAVALGDFSVYAWNEGEAVKRLDLKPYGKKVKPEALVILDQDAANVHALLMFDGPKEGQPTPVDIPLQ